MILLPRDSAVYDLLVHALVRDERNIACPFLQIEEFGKELECSLFAQHLEPEYAIQVCLKDRRRLLKLGDKALILFLLILRLCGKPVCLLLNVSVQ